MNCTTISPRRERNLVIGALCCFMLAWLLYAVLGHWLIRHIYERQTPWDAVNNVISNPPVHPVDFYFAEGNAFFINLSAWGLIAACSAIFVRYRLLPAYRGEPNQPTGLSLSLFVALLGLACINRFVQDDAFISYRYARNFEEGHGLIWNLGEPPIQGYTNPTWTLIAAIPLRLELDPVRFMKGIGLICFAVNLWITYRLACFLTKSALTANLTLLLLGTNYTFSAYATGGLETQFHSMLLMSVAYLVLVPPEGTAWSISRLVGISLVAAAAMLTRLDSALMLSILFACLLYQIVRDQTSFALKTKQAVAALLPACILGAIFATWTLSYYGDIVPNTYYVKASSDTSARQGVQFVWDFLLAYGWIPFVIVTLWQFPRLKAKSASFVVLFSLIAVWTAYVIKVGGGCMEYRLMVAILPIASILMVAALAQCCKFRLQLACLVALAVVSLIHACQSEGKHGIQTIAGLSAIERRWEQLGRKLGKLFPAGESQVVIGITAAGVIPYYSRLNTVDMFGLNDRRVAREGLYWGNRPGHQRLASAEYLLEKKVNLVFGQPVMGKRNSKKLPPMHRSEFYLVSKNPATQVPANLKAIEIPFGEELGVMVLYLTPHESIDQLIEKMHLRTTDVID